MIKSQMPSQNEALPGRMEKVTVTNTHYITGNPLLPPFPIKCKTILFGLGCFWGAEREFWSLPGVYTTAVGYTAGLTPNPTYQEVCSELTGHNETVLIAYQPHLLEFETLLKIFWDAHDPTQGMRQGNDIGTQYRSGIYTHDREQNDLALASKNHHQQTLTNAGFGNITTEIMAALEFYYAEDYHQQYLAKNPNGYCGLGGLGVEYTIKSAFSPQSE